MMRLLLIGGWVLVVALASTFGGVYVHAHKSAAPAEPQHAAKLEVKKVKPVTVPVIADGVLKGYVATDLSYVAEAPDKHGAESAVDPESYVMDETFRLIYGEQKIDFTQIEKLDLDGLTKEIAKRVNARLGGGRIKEILIKGLNFVPKEDIPR